MHLLFDYQKCTGCGLCRQACGSHYISMDENNRPFLELVSMCSDCGNCMAICPTDAVVNTRMDLEQFTPMKDPGISFDQYLSLVRNRRSIRLFRSDLVDPAVIHKLLSSVRYIPTGSNKQGLNYLIITNAELLDQIRNAMAKKFRFVWKLAKTIPIRWFVKKEDKEGLKRLVDIWDSGEDPYLRGAPCLLIIYAEEMYFGISAWDSGIATYNLDLAAQTLGLGTLQNGFFVTTCRMFKSIKKLTKLPRKVTILGAMCLGKPVLKFRKTVGRNPLKVDWLPPMD